MLEKIITGYLVVLVIIPIYMYFLFNFSKQIAYSQCENKKDKYSFKEINKEEKEEQCGWKIYFTLFTLISVLIFLKLS